MGQAFPSLFSLAGFTDYPQRRDVSSEFTPWQTPTSYPQAGDHPKYDHLICTGHPILSTQRSPHFLPSALQRINPIPSTSWQVWRR